MVNQEGIHPIGEDERTSEKSHLHLHEGDSPKVPKAPARVSETHRVYKVII